MQVGWFLTFSLPRFKGRVNCVLQRNLTFKSYATGSYFGDLEILNNTPRMFSVKAEEYTTLIVLTASGIEEAFRVHKHSHQTFINRTIERLILHEITTQKIEEFGRIPPSDKFWIKRTNEEGDEIHEEIQDWLDRLALAKEEAKTLRSPRRKKVLVLKAVEDHSAQTNEIISRLGLFCVLKGGPRRSSLKGLESIGQAVESLQKIIAGIEAKLEDVDKAAQKLKDQYLKSINDTKELEDGVKIIIQRAEEGEYDTALDMGKELRVLLEARKSKKIEIPLSPIITSNKSKMMLPFGLSHNVMNQIVEEPVEESVGISVHSSREEPAQDSLEEASKLHQLISPKGELMGKRTLSSFAPPILHRKEPDQDQLLYSNENSAKTEDSHPADHPRPDIELKKLVIGKEKRILNRKQSDNYSLKNRKVSSSVEKGSNRISLQINGENQEPPLCRTSSSGGRDPRIALIKYANNNNEDDNADQVQKPTFFQNLLGPIRKHLVKKPAASEEQKTPGKETDKRLFSPST